MMRSRRLPLIFLVLGLVAAFPARGQEAHPLTGDWTGYWGPSPDHQNRVRVTMEWTGREIVGVINPGSENIPLKNGVLDPSDWSVHLEADATDASGNPVTYIIDGRIEDLGSPHRSIVGDWTHGEVRGTFRITMQ